MNVKSGVLQATVLVIIYVDNINQAGKNALLGCFADDTRLTKPISSLSIEEDMILLANSLQRVITWAKQNNMELNEYKFDFCDNSRTVTKLLKCIPFTQCLFQYETGKGNIIVSEEVVRDLDVDMSSDYLWENHLAKSADDGIQMLSCIL